MWIKLKTKEGDTLADLAKQHSVKDLIMVRGNPKNRGILKLLKDPAQPIKKGTVIWFPDNRAKCYAVKFRGTDYVYDKNGFEQFKKDVVKVMEHELRGVKEALASVQDRHDLQLRMTSEHWYVNAVISLRTTKPEPRSPRKTATAAVAHLEGIVRSRDFKRYEQFLKIARGTIEYYQRELNVWIANQIGQAETSGLVFKWAKTYMGEYCGSIVLASVFSPASLVGKIAVAALANSGSTLIVATAGEAGKAIAGKKMSLTGSLKTIAEQALKSGIFGAIGAAFAAMLLKKALPFLLKYLTSGSTLANQASRLAKTKYIKDLVAQEVKIAVKNFGKKAGEEYLPDFAFNNEKLLVPRLVKFLIEEKSSLTVTVLGNNPTIKDAAYSLVKADWKKISGTNETQAANHLAQVMSKDSAVDSVYDALVRQSEQRLRNWVNTDAKQALEAAVH